MIMSMMSVLKHKNLKSYLPIVFSTLAITLWIAFSAWINTSQFGDNIEQFNWAHSAEWGYWKHPPLPTLLLIGVIAILGHGIYWAYCLAAFCFIGVVFLTWKIASKLLGEHAAGVIAILLSLHLGFSWRGQIYNHNTVLLLMVAATVWTILLSTENRKLWCWGLAGSMAGLALLTKYQALVPLLGILLALQISGSLKDKQNLLGLGFAIIIACLVFMPHFLWLYTNDFPTVQYAKHSAHNLDIATRFKSLLSFIFTQLRSHLPLIIALGLGIGYFRTRNRHIHHPVDDTKDNALNTPYLTAWLWGLIGFPAIFLTLMTLLGGVQLESHWGLQTFQFACLWLVWRFKASIDTINTVYFLIAALLVHIVYMGLYYQSSNPDRAKVSSSRIDRIYPAQTLAERTQHDWQQATHCPLKYVIGSPYEAGVISLYSNKFPMVMEEQVDGFVVNTPWIKPSDIISDGAIEVWNAADKIPAGVIPTSLLNVSGQDSNGNPQNVYWHIILPQHSCSA